MNQTIQKNKLDNIVQDIPNWNSWFSIAPKTQEHFSLWIYEFFGFKIPWDWNKKCSEHSFPLDAMWEAYAEMIPLSIWYANRGGGKTFDVSLLGFMESIFKPKCGCNILGGSLDQSQKTIAYLTDFWDFDNAPKQLLVNGQVAGRGYKLTNGSWIRALAASSKSVRGSHQPKLRIDEVDELDRKIYEAALGQPKTMFGIPSNVIISSTLHNPFGLMSDIVEEREKTGAKLFQWCVNEIVEPHGFWTKEEIEEKKRQLTQAMWDAEYLCKRPKIGETIFDFESVDRAYRRGLEIEFNDKVKSEACIDWGYTCTVLHIVQDYREYQNVPCSFNWEYRELTERCKEIVDICIEKNVRVIYCDSNPKDSHMTLKKIIKQKRALITVTPVAFSVYKDIAINVIRFLLERNLVNIKDKTFQDKMKKYHYKDVEQEIIDKVDDHYPDAFIAWAASRWKILGNNFSPPKKQTKKGKVNAGILG